VILIRPLTSADRRAIAFSFGRLGERSRYQRFLAPVRELSPLALERMAQLDHWHHEAFIAYSPVPRMPIGLAEYVRLEAFDEAEPALAVVDAWQRRGVGSALAAALRERALATGVRRFRAVMLPGNRGALALARTLGEVRATGGYLSELAIELSSHRPAASATAARSPVRL
jgi:GNAT superfamily N-acetyltransferase